MVQLRAARNLAPGTTVTFPTSLERWVGSDPHARPPDAFPESEFMTRLAVSSVLEELSLHLGDAAPFRDRYRGGWWRMVELDRRHHLKWLCGVEPRRPGDLDLVIGPWGDRPSVEHLIGMELKLLKYDESGVMRSPVDRIGKATQQAHGLLALGCDQSVVCFGVTMRPEELSAGMDGRAARKFARDQVLHDLHRRFEESIPPCLGIVVLFWDAPPRTNTVELSYLTIFKFRRPASSPSADLRVQDIKRRLGESLLRHLEHARVDHPSQTVRACPACYELVIVRPAEASCSACRTPWPMTE